MLKYILLLFLSFFIIGCTDNTSSHKDSKYLSITKAPINGKSLDIEAKIALEFSADLDLSSISETTAYIEDLNGTKVGCVIDAANPANKIIFTPYIYLQAEKKFNLVITTGIKDAQGRSLSENYIFEFETSASSGDTTPLSIRATKPSNADNSVAIATNIVVDFSKNISTAPQYLTDNSTPYLSVSSNGVEINGQ